MRQIAYTSLARRSVTEELLNEIAVPAAKFNATVGVTGILLCEGRRFMQVLEGGSEAVEKCWSRICADPRHNTILKVFDRTITTRSFTDWSMIARHPGVTTERHQEFVKEVKGDVQGLNDPRLQAFVIGFALLGSR